MWGNPFVWFPAHPVIRRAWFLKLDVVSCEEKLTEFFSQLPWLIELAESLVSQEECLPYFSSPGKVLPGSGCLPLLLLAVKFGIVSVLVHIHPQFMDLL